MVSNKRALLNVNVWMLAVRANGVRVFFHNVWSKANIDGLIKKNF
jgi:hypothetical protein